MGARRLRLMIVALLCGLVCALGTGLLPAPATATQFAGTQFGKTESQGKYIEAEAAGQLDLPIGVAVNNDPSSSFYGDVYVTDQPNNRVDRFSGSGDFQLAWGWGVINGANEFQTCTTTCEQGKVEEQGAPAPINTGSVAFPAGVAVDNAPLSASAGDVYVVQSGDIYRVEKFDASGKFLLMFGGHVNETTGGNVCVAGEKCERATEGSGDGEFDGLAARANAIAVGPGGAVYVGDKARVQVFEPSGAWKESISLAGISSTGTVTALTVDGSGDVFVKDSEATGVHEFEPGGLEKSVQLDPASTSVTALTVDGSGDLFVGDSNGGFHVLKYKPSGKEVDSFGAKTVKIPFNSTEGGFTAGLAFSQALDAVDAPEYYREDVDQAITPPWQTSVWSVPVPPPGPSVEGQSATIAPRGSATLEGAVNPEGNETQYRFEYVNDVQFNASGYANASSTTSSSLAASLEDQPVSAHIAGLSPNTVYHYRLTASNGESESPATGPDETFTTPPPALVEGPWVTNVASTSATFNARINPFGESTQYRVEYGTSSSYGNVLPGSVGEGTSYVVVSHHTQELQPGTTYHYRIVTINELGSSESNDRTFTTEPVGEGLTLPDGRVWELVSPPDKKGSLIEPVNEAEIQAAANGNGITYMSYEAIGEDAMGKGGKEAQILSRRAPGWKSQDISIPRGISPEGETASSMTNLKQEYWLFSANLSQAIVEPQGIIPSLSPEIQEGERTLYLRDNSQGTYQSLVSTANAPPGTKLDDKTEEVLKYLASTPDLSHVVLESQLPLTVESTTAADAYNLYEWSAGQLKLVDILPDGEPFQLISRVNNTGDVYLGVGGDNSDVGSSTVSHTISNNGRWIAWQAGALESPTHLLYVRDMVEEKTLQIGGSQAIFQTMSSDGSRVFYMENGELYEFDTATDTQTDLTASHGSGESSANAQYAALGASEDGSYVYFVAQGVLAGGAVKGEDNLYVAHEEAGAWSTAFIATLSSEDGPNWHQASSGVEAGCDHQSCPVQLGDVTSRVSPNGRYLEFMSNRSLTGYDNVDALSGQPDEEVYLYDAVAGRVVCASCDPTGARPNGVYEIYEESGGEGPFYDKAEAWVDHWLAANVPAWRGPGSFRRRAQYQPRFLSNSGRLFFDSPDALAPQDTNGLMDVYQYEPEGVGSCAATDSTFSQQAQGCVSPITSGTSSSESAFLDASETGDDVFFVTTARLTSADYDTSYDVYDAHVCSSEVPCVALPVSPPPCTSGDSCKAAPSPQPEIFGPPPSATFSGTGNVIEEAKKSVAKTKKKAKEKKAKKKPKLKKHATKKHRGKKAQRSRTGNAIKKGNR